MDSATLQNIRSRADAKLLYAQIHLNELKGRGTNGGTDFDRAFQESFLFHLLGAKEAFLIELNHYYAAGLDPANVRPGNLREILRSNGVVCQELAELYELENNEESWLFHAKQMRDFCAHIDGVARAYHIGGVNHGKVFLCNPKSGRFVELHVLDAFTSWLVNMRELLEKLRVSAIRKDVA